MQRNQRGFTLIELTIAIVLIGIIASMAVIKFTNLAPATLSSRQAAAIHTALTAHSLAVAALGRYPTYGELIGSSTRGFFNNKSKYVGTGPGYIQAGGNYVGPTRDFNALLFKVDGKYYFVWTYSADAPEGVTDSLTRPVTSIGTAMNLCEPEGLVGHCGDTSGD